MICDFNQASIMQVTQTPAGLKVQHNSGAGAPGNCTKHLGFPVVCTNGTGNSPYLYDQNAIIAAYQGWSGTSATTCAADAPYIAG